MSWDFDFDADDSFTPTFDGADSIFVSGSDSLSTDPFDNSFSQSEIDLNQFMTPQPIQQISTQNAQSTSKTVQQSQGSLAEENDQLRQFFTTLKEKAAQAESLNQSLKSQLEDCRNWFKDAMFTGITNHK